MKMTVLRLFLIIQFSFYSFLAKIPQPAVDASCRDDLAAAVRAPAHRTGLLSADVGKVGAKRSGVQTASARGSEPGQSLLRLPGLCQPLETPEGKTCYF